MPPKSWKEAYGAKQELEESGQRQAMVSFLLKKLENTEESEIRNRAALILSDLKELRAIDIIVKLLKSEKTQGKRGTLVYALEPFNNTALLPLLIDLVITDGWEASREAFHLVENMSGEIDEEVWDSCRAKIHIAIQSADEERMPLLEDLLMLFKGGENN